VTHGEIRKPWCWIFFGRNLRYSLLSANIPDFQHVSSLGQQSVNICITYLLHKIIDFNDIFSVLLDFPGIRAKWSHLTFLFDNVVILELKHWRHKLGQKSLGSPSCVNNMKTTQLYRSQTHFQEAPPPPPVLFLPGVSETGNNWCHQLPATATARAWSSCQMRCQQTVSCELLLVNSVCMSRMRPCWRRCLISNFPIIRGVQEAGHSLSRVVTQGNRHLMKGWRKK